MFILQLPLFSIMFHVVVLRLAMLLRRAALGKPTHTVVAGAHLAGPALVAESVGAGAVRGYVVRAGQRILALVGVSVLISVDPVSAALPLATRSAAQSGGKRK